MPRLVTFLLSLGLHVVAVALLVEAGRSGRLAAASSHTFRERIAPERKRLIWYVNPAPLPPVAPLEAPPGPSAKRPAERAPQLLRAAQPRPESRRQMILQSPPSIRLEADVPLANTIEWKQPQAPLQRFRVDAPPIPRAAPKPLGVEALELDANPVPAPQLPIVVVGLDPPAIPLPPPPGNRAADFSAGPLAPGPDPPAAARPSLTADLRIPHLAIAPAATAGLARAGFRRQLLASVALSTKAAANGVHSSDPHLTGASVYTLALDMPNVTSFDGSWTLRFTELGGSSPDDVLTAPVPLRKVDPTYHPSAAAEGIEGKVLLHAVIGRDGRVDQVRLVQGIDERLDTAAVAAFAKWEFRPATKDGLPVDLEAVVQIPFRLRKSAR